MKGCYYSLHLHSTVNNKGRRSHNVTIIIYTLLSFSLFSISPSPPRHRAIAGLFNVAHEMSRGSQDPSFPRLGQMLTEYDHALRKISEDFIPLAKVRG